MKFADAERLARVPDRLDRLVRKLRSYQDKPLSKSRLRAVVDSIKWAKNDVQSVIAALRKEDS